MTRKKSTGRSSSSSEKAQLGKVLKKKKETKLDKKIVLEEDEVRDLTTVDESENEDNSSTEAEGDQRNEPSSVAQAVKARRKKKQLEAEKAPENEGEQSEKKKYFSTAYGAARVRQLWSLEEIRTLFEAIKMTGGVDDFKDLAEILPDKSVEEIEQYVNYCQQKQSHQWTKTKSMFDCDKPKMPVEFWLSAMDDLTGNDNRWLRRAFSLALSIIGHYEQASLPNSDDDGNIPDDEPNYGAIYNWISTLMLGYPEQPKSLRPIDALIVLDLLEQLQQSAELRVSKNVPPLELLQRKHMLLKTSIPKKDPHWTMLELRKEIKERHTALALASEDQCDLMRFTDSQMKSLLLNPPLRYDEDASPDLLPPSNSEKNTNQADDVPGSSASNDDDAQKIKKPFAQRLQGINPFRLSRKYSRLDLWSFTEDNDEAEETVELL